MGAERTLRPGAVVPGGGPGCSSGDAPGDRPVPLRAAAPARPSASSSRPAASDASGVYPPWAFAARTAISSGDTSSTCVEIDHVWPNGSVTMPERSP